MKPSENEEKYFIDLELKRRLDRARAEQEAVATAVKRRLKELHFMHCPSAANRLMPSRRRPWKWMSAAPAGGFGLMPTNWTAYWPLTREPCPGAGS